MYREHGTDWYALLCDKRFSEPTPNKEPKVVYEFVRQKLIEYIAAHPGDVRIVDEPDQRLPSRPVPPVPRNAQEWVAQKLTDAHFLQWRELCKGAHSLCTPSDDALPAGAKSEITTHRPRR